MANKSRQSKDTLFLKHFVRSSTEVTDEEVAYFRDHPDEIDEITAEVNIHKFFLAGGAILGTALVGVSKTLSYTGALASLTDGVREFLVEIVFEIGVALIGAAVTAYLLGVLLNKQQENASHWRAEIRRRIDETGRSD